MIDSDQIVKEMTPWERRAFIVTIVLSNIFGIILAFDGTRKMYLTLFVLSLLALDGVLLKMLIRVRYELGFARGFLRASELQFRREMGLR